MSADKKKLENQSSNIGSSDESHQYRSFLSKKSPIFFNKIQRFSLNQLEKELRTLKKKIEKLQKIMHFIKKKTNRGDFGQFLKN